MNEYDKYEEGDEFSLKWWLLFFGIAILVWCFVFWLGWWAISSNLGGVEGKDLVANQETPTFLLNRLFPTRYYLFF